jgi:2-polyprenyl-6-methoxyphenol hydroxylase-like FAD-dependent oxidoreductase
MPHLTHTVSHNPKSQPQPQTHATNSKDEELLIADRGVMRNILIKGLEPHVTFSKSFLSYSTTSSGIIAHFSDGTQASGSLLIGGDGARSRVRRQFVPEQRLLDTGARVFCGKTVLTPQLLEKLNEKAAAGLSIVRDKETGLVCLLEPMRFRGEERERLNLPEDYVYWVLLSMDGFGMSDDVLLGLGGEDAKSETVNLVGGWDEGFRVLLEEQDKAQCVLVKLLSGRPELPVWDSKDNGRVTLIGDAAHAMSPTAAVGAVIALKNVAVLARVLREEGVSGENLKRYEGEMRGPAEGSIKGSFAWGKALFGMKDVKDMMEVEE